MDETRIDAAPTPAHVFAYRAFRSVFIASPESSPIRPQHTTYSYDNKENHHVTSLAFGHSKFSTSPTSSIKRKTTSRDALSLTPKRQKTIAISPTKSILKNPNAPTPKRPGLRDMSVTFKDIRNSASPHLALAQHLTSMSLKNHTVQQESKLRTASESAHAMKKIDHNQTKQHASTGTVLNQQTQPVESPEEQEHAAMVAEIVRNPAFDVNDYVVKTEKELRRFAAYGKKWKKQAQKQDQEVERLNILLQEAQKENERLKRKLASKEETDGKHDISMTRGTTEQQNRTIPDHLFTSDQSIRSHRNGNAKDNAIFSTVVQKSDSTVRKPEKDSNGSKSVEYEKTTGRKDTSLLGAGEYTSRNRSPIITTQKPSSSTPTAEFEFRDPRFPSQQPNNRGEKAQILPSQKSSPKIFTAGSNISATTAAPAPTVPKATTAPTCISLTLDRQAAARARIRQRNEERKASLGIKNLGQNGRVVERRVVSLPDQNVDESEVDWAALGH